MIPTIATVTLGGPLPNKLRAAAEAGFHGFELFDSDLGDLVDAPAVLRRMIQDSGLALTDYFPLRDFEGMPDDQRAGSFDRAARYLDLAAEIGAGMVMACSNSHPDSLPDGGRIAADLHDLGDLAAARGLRVAYEALAWGQHVHDYRIARDLVRRAAHPQVGLVLDTFHILARGIDVAEIREIPAEQIFLVQISDAPWLDLDYMSWSRRHRTLPGRGSFAFDPFLAALRATGYDGVVSLECFSDDLRAEPAVAVAAAGQDALARLWSGAAA